MHVYAETRQTPFKLAAALWPHISMLPNTNTSLVRRMNAMLINCVAEKATAHGDGGTVMSVAFSPDGTKIVSGSGKGTIEVWDSGALRAQNRPSLAKTDA